MELKSSGSVTAVLLNSNPSLRELFSGSDRARLGRGNASPKFHGHLKHGWKNIPKFHLGGGVETPPRPPPYETAQ